MTREGESGKRVHPTQKPILLCENVILSYDAKSIVDLFLGSGSTLIACEKTGRTCYGMEIDPKYVDVIIKRWENFTGQKAELLENPDTSERPMLDHTGVVLQVATNAKPKPTPTPNPKPKPKAKPKLKPRPKLKTQGPHKPKAP